MPRRVRQCVAVLLRSAHAARTLPDKRSKDLDVRQSSRIPSRARDEPHVTLSYNTRREEAHEYLLAMFSIVCCAVAAIATTTVTVEAVTRHPLVVVLSFDGFRADYVQADVTPHLVRFRDASAAPPYMRAAFPTKTFVNHFTVATGLHPETHGVLDNYMFSDNHNGTMYYSYELFHYDESVVPIWVSFRKIFVSLKCSLVLRINHV